jgi:O-antigen ligase
MPESNVPPSGPVYFLRNKMAYYLTLVIIATTLFSWFNVNSVCIMLLLLYRLLDGSPVASIRTAFSNKYFLAYFSIFALELTGLLYTHDFFRAWKHMESKATLAAIPFILCAGPFTDKAGRRRLMSAYCGLLFITCLYCLFAAARLYNLDKDPSVFFYHALTSTISVNAVFFSAYVIVALLFLLSHPLCFGETPPYQGPDDKPSPTLIPHHAPDGGSPSSNRSWLTASTLRIIRIGLVLFFTGMMVLLSSKLLLALLVIILVSFLAGKYKLGLNPRPLLAVGLLVLAGTGMLVCTDNPVTRRYKEISEGDIGLYKESTLPPETVFNGLSLRLLIWKYSCEILNDQKAWVFGVTGGDSQDLLDNKYKAAGISKGFLGYNFHNQYIEELVRSGLPGLCVFLAACGVLIGMARAVDTREAWFTITMVLILYLTESMLEMQHSTFFSCIFPLLLWQERPGQ